MHSIKKKISIGGIGVLGFLLAGTLFLDSEFFAFSTPIGRFRPNIIVIIFSGLYMVLNYLNNPKPFKINYLLKILILYVLFNLISLFLNFDGNLMRFNYGLRIVFLLSLWILVIFFLTKMFKNQISALKFIKTLYVFVFIQSLIGFFQMFPPFIRPTGTISCCDSDFFSIMLMGPFISLVVLKILKVKIFSSFFDNILISSIAINILGSFVRSSWIGIIAAFLFFFFFAFRNKLGSKVSKIANFKKIFSLSIVFSVFLSIVFLSSSSQLQEFTKNRLDFNRVNEKGELSGSSIQGNIRLLMMAVSFENAMKNPIIGNGPAAFTTQGMKMDHNKVLHAGDFAFDPSIVTTIFNDTGLIGVFLFLFFIKKFFSYIFKTFRENEDDILAKYALSFSVAIAGLLVAYIPSTALWIPFSWVYFSIPIALAISINNQRT